MDSATIVTTLRSAGCVFAEDEAALLLAAGGDLPALVARRAAGEPLEYVLGWAEFCGVRMTVAPGVFVPRHRTEALVQQAIRLSPPAPTIVDMCCGCGALGRAFADRVPGATVHATDIDPVAVQCATANLTPVGGTAYVGDLFEALPSVLRGQIDLVLANVPYVPTDAVELMPPEARLFERRAALDGGPDGLNLLRRVAAEARGWLRPGGHLLSEIALSQRGTSEEVLREEDFAVTVAHWDQWDATTVLGSLPCDTSHR